MNIFEDYASHYDAFYKTKDYAGEANYVHDLIQRHRPNARRLIDLGCGTGRHARAFAEMGYKVTGVDRSRTMLDQAQRTVTGEQFDETIEFCEADLRSLSLGQTFDAAVAMFHVVSYLTANADLLDTFKAVRRHLETNGIFVFDFWYGPGVLTDRPTQRLKHVVEGDVQVMRFAAPQLNLNENTVAVKYSVLALNDETKHYEIFEEQHLMRYFFKPEIELMLEASAFRMIGFQTWMSAEPPEAGAWDAVVIAVATS